MTLLQLKRLGVAISLAVLLPSCQPANTGPKFEIFRPTPPSWFIGTWEGHDTEDRFWFEVASHPYGSTMTRSISSLKSSSSGGLYASTLRDYHGFNDTYKETKGDNFYELSPNRTPTYSERFTLNASGSIDYLETETSGATRSLTLTKK